MTARRVGANEWIITVQENSETKELYIQLPEDALSQVGWCEGDTIVWEEESEGKMLLTKKEENNEQDKTNRDRKQDHR